MPLILNLGGELLKRQGGWFLLACGLLGGEAAAFAGKTPERYDELLSRLEQLAEAANWAGVIEETDRQAGSWIEWEEAPPAEGASRYLAQFFVYRAAAQLAVGRQRQAEWCWLSAVQLDASEAETLRRTLPQGNHPLFSRKPRTEPLPVEVVPVSLGEFTYGRDEWPKGKPRCPIPFRGKRWKLQVETRNDLEGNLSDPRLERFPEEQHPLFAAVALFFMEERKHFPGTVRGKVTPRPHVSIGQCSF